MYVAVSLCVQVSQRPEEGVRSHDIGVMGGCELPLWVLGAEPGSSARTRGPPTPEVYFSIPRVHMRGGSSAVSNCEKWLALSLLRHLEKRKGELVGK